MIRKHTEGFFASRWHSEVELRVLLWRDVLAVGTLVNLVAGFAGLIMLSQNVTAMWAVLVHFAPLPYNIFLLAAVWRSKQCTPFTSLIIGIWFVLMLVI